MEIDDVTYAINGAVFEVNKILGPGFLEKVYENAMLVELSKRGIKAESQVPINVSFKDQQVGEYVADLFVEDKVIVELKTVNQLLNFLTCFNLLFKWYFPPLAAGVVSAYQLQRTLLHQGFLR